ncbi:MAG: extracellular solute-binding protein [Deltaproteobacteria bacterium]|nr:extracellular solute-binding protein [Deltaproteobacteria bacterium]
MNVYASRWVLTSLLLFFATTLHAQSSILEGAKKEGKLVYYTALTAPESRALLAAFEKKYPFIRTELFRLEGDKMRNKILTEARAGRHSFDVNSTSITNTGLLMRSGMLASYKARARDRVWPGLKDDDGYWTGLYVRQYALSYNTHLVSAKEAPKDWWDLFDPKWKGKIGLDEEVELYGGLCLYWGREKALKLLKGLAAQQPLIRNGHTLIAQLTAAGEFPVSIAYSNRIEDMKAKGAPVDWSNTTDPVVASPSVITMSAHAPHPNAARLFLEFALSYEAQSLLAKFDRVPAHQEIPAPTPKQDLKKMKVFFVNTKISDRFEEYQKEYREIFGR